jgi:Sugar (and other) transporter
MGFTLGWMATVWVYPPEILPLKIRAKGAALAAAADFLGNFLVVEITPYGIQNIGWKFYLVWAVLNLANAIIVWMFYPETAGQPLEAVDALFIDSRETDPHRSSLEDAAARLQAHKKTGVHRLQWSVVQKAKAQVKWYKSRRKSDATLVTDERRSKGETGDEKA